MIEISGQVFGIVRGFRFQHKSGISDISVHYRTLLYCTFSSRILDLYSTHVWVAEWLRHLLSNTLTVVVVSSIPSGGNHTFC